MNEKDFVTLEVAKLLKEKGFNEECYTYYIDDALIYYVNPNKNNIYENSGLRLKNPMDQYLSSSGFLAPTLCQAQKWLREKHSCYVQVTHETHKTEVKNLVQVLFYESDKSTDKYGDNAEFDTYEDALNFGILKALKRI